MSTFYVTTPIYYVNDLPHLGHIYTTVVADTIARYRRLRGEEVYFLTGTDEHGQNVLRAAQRQGIAPQQLADRVVSRYHQLWRQLDISHDDFIRTTQGRHRRGVEALIRRIREAGDLYVDRHDGWYCASCESFYTEKELLGEGLCPVHEVAAEWHSEKNVFFRLSKYQDRLLEWMDRSPGCVQPESRANEVRSFIESGLKDLSVSRADLAWGIPFPSQEGQTTYVWLDALTNYLSALGLGSEGEERELYQRFWGGGEGVRLHLVGKDILRFHAVYWPAFLLSAGLPLPTTVWAHGWWLRDQRKMSKSTGNLVRPDELLATFGPDVLRYFMLREMVFGQDANFSDEAFLDRYNSDLANDLGNTVSRLVTLSRRAFDGRTPPVSCDGNPLIEAAGEAARGYMQAMDGLAFHKALAALWKLLSETNQYLVAREPWKLLKEGEKRSESVARILWNGLESVRIVASGLMPCMPELAKRVLQAVGSEPEAKGLEEAFRWGGTPVGRELPAPEPLFPRIDKEQYFEAEASTPDGESAQRDTSEESKETGEMITIEEFFRTQLRVATVESAEAIPNSKKLLKLEVDLGGERRTLVAGIAQEYLPGDLVGRQVVVVTNLQPAKLMGVESQGMVLAASDDGRPVLLRPEAEVPNGTPVK